jgi:hypothetical protein
LYIFDEGQFQEFVVWNRANNSGDALESCTLGCAPSSFTGDELVTRTALAHEERLDYTVGANGLREFFQARLIKVCAWLSRTRLDEVYINFEQLFASCRRCIRQQCAQAPA